MKIQLKHSLQLTLLIFATLMFTSAVAQDIITVTGAKGSGIIAGTITPAQARQEAINQAKVEALRKAGVTENLQSYQSLFKSEVDNDFTEFFSSDVQAELQGAVKDYTIVSEENKVDGSVFFIEITIDATVILYDAKPDPTFSVRVNGVKGIYENGEELKFSVFSTQDCYLHIFTISDFDTWLLYPNQYEEQKVIPASKNVEFPFGHVEYWLAKNEKAKDVEMNRVVFVFTKQPVSFLNFTLKEDQITTNEAVFSWIYGLMPDQRKVDFQVFTIR